MPPAIRVENLSKQYKLGLTHAGSLRELASRWTNRVVGRKADVSPQPVAGEGPGVRGDSSSSSLAPSPQPLAPASSFWALRDVSFDVQPGEVLGIIGRNGAGKSTLLKILSRITSPTSGRIEINGRVASLLEVGTGFHPELTGRENVYLNGAILGMTKAEVRRKFDEIIAFAEIDKFIDTPVKRYSSGMYVRLAFAVAAHLEPEILIVDEVLAVGDAEFQKRCLTKMGEVATGGRTVVFVSHNMNAIEAICERVVFLCDGRTAADSRDVKSVINSYLFAGSISRLQSSWLKQTEAYDHPCFTPWRFAITDGDGDELTAPQRNDADTWIEIDGVVETIDPALNVGYAIYNEAGLLVYWSTVRDDRRWCEASFQPGKVHFKSRLPSRFLNEGDYRIELIAALHFRQWMSQPGVDAPSIRFTVRGGLSDSPYWIARRPGIAAPSLEWEAVLSGRAATAAESLARNDPIHE